MSTGTAIITDALKALGVNSVVSPPAPENIIDGMNSLNSMLELWRSQSIILGTIPLEDPGDNLNEPPDTRNAIVSNLALDMAAYFNNGQQVVSPILKRSADVQYQTVANIYRNQEIPEKGISSTTPVGEGNRRGVNYWVFFPKGSSLGD